MGACSGDGRRAVATGVSDDGRCMDGTGGIDCDEAVRQLYRFLDGELTEQRRREIAVHLDDCGWCGDAAGFEAELRTVIANRCRDRVPEALKARVAAAIRAESLRQEPPGAGVVAGAADIPTGGPPDDPGAAAASGTGA